MQQPGEVLTVEPCNICGDVGYPEAIATCCKCNINREHVYCMRIYRTDVPDDWICDSCQSKNGAASPCKVNQDFGLQTSKRQRAVTTGKVKFLHEEEVIKLSFSNAPMKPIPANSTFLMTRKASVGSKNVISKISSQIPSVGSKNVISKISSQTPKSNPGISMVLGKLPRNDVVHKNQMTDKHAFHSLSKGPAKEHRHVSKRRVGAMIPDKKVETCDLQIEKPTKGPPCESLSARSSLPIVGSGRTLVMI
ncbi:Zinc finger, FYVE/PHD-type [Sesbania bispinosa]|nr:Zinc finger, FYVE/PHD-type [Sesbania bispinosa]